MLPGLETLPVWEFGKPEIHKILDRILDRGSGVMANRTLSAVKKLTKWALGRGYISVDPCAGIEPPHKEKSRDRVLSAEELVALWEAADDLVGGAPFRFLVLTGQRTGEVANLKWADIRNGVWHLSQTKNDRPHAVPLPKQAKSLLGSLKRTQGYVFGSPERPFANWSRLKRQLDSRTGIESWRLHDVRRTVATNLARLGVRPDVTEAVLNHTSGARAGVAGIYNRHDYCAEIGGAIRAWAERMERMLVDTNLIELRA